MARPVSSCPTDAGTRASIDRQGCLLSSYQSTSSWQILSVRRFAAMSNALADLRVLNRRTIPFVTSLRFMGTVTTQAMKCTDSEKYSRRTESAPLSSLPDFDRVVQEADRLSQLAEQSKKSISEENASQAIVAARDLLSIANQFNYQKMDDKEAMEEQRVASLHRAFLSITSWCLDFILEGSLSLEDSKELLDQTVDLARRAFNLSLPFHLPLYQRLMNTVAKHDTRKSDTADTILEISSWATVMLDTPIPATFFDTVLQTLSSQKRFGQVTIVLRGMQARHAIQGASIATAADLLNTVSNSIETHSQDSSFSETEATELINELEESITSALEHSDTSESIRERIDALFRQLNSPANPNDGKGNLASFDKERWKDALVLDIATLNQRHDKTKTLLSDLTKDTQKLVEKPLFRRVGQYNRGDEIIEVVQVQDISDSDDTDDSTDPDDLLYMRDSEKYRLPDITEYVEELNGDKKLLFTEEYEDTLWLRDYDNNIAMFESVFGEERSDDDSSDDSDDDGDVH